MEESKSTARVAVVIPCFNHSNVLRRTLESIKNQTLKPFELVVVDDGSIDSPEKIVHEFNDSLPVVFVKLSENHGAPYARNLGAEKTTAEFLLFLDADAELVPDAIETFVRALEGRPEVSFVYSNFLWGSKRFRGRSFDVEALKKRNFIHTSSLLRRAVFPGFDQSLKKFQDWDLWLTIIERGGKGFWIDRELYRIEPRRAGISRWLPRIAYLIPWSRLGFVPKEIANYHEAESIIRKKRSIT
jgi:glycosyltransferase involved in cell wall biosynthesis